MTSKHYVYGLRTPVPIIVRNVQLECNDLFYIGKGSKERAWKHLRDKNKNNELKRAAHERIKAQNAEIIIEILEGELEANDAYDRERELIAEYGRLIAGTGKLTNLTEGGKGGSGFAHSTETRKKMSDQRKGRPAANKGKKRPGIGGRKKGSKWTDADSAARSFQFPALNQIGCNAARDKAKALKDQNISWTLVTNGVDQKRVMSNQIIPHGYYAGKPLLRPIFKKHWYTNGIDSILSLTCPESWREGRIIKNTKNLKILTDSGWSDFRGIYVKPDMSILTLFFEDSQITCTHDHKIFISDTESVEAQYLSIGDSVITSSGFDTLIDIKEAGIKPVYDILSVEKQHRFFADDILISNCEFTGSSESLINPIALKDLHGVEPLFKTGQVRWYAKPKPNRIYVVGLDPAGGGGGDYSAIQMFQLPEMIQVAEWQDNRVPIPGQVKAFHSILCYLDSELRAHPEQRGDPEIYWSIEGNTGYGEYAIQTIRETGEDNFPGTFVHEPVKKKQAIRRKKGFLTTEKTKLSACSRLKALVENRKITISSLPLVRELKFFVAAGSSFRAQPGEHDDLIMALSIVIRIMQTLVEHDSYVASRLKEDIMESEPEDPFPMIMPGEF